MNASMIAMLEDSASTDKFGCSDETAAKRFSEGQAFGKDILRKGGRFCVACDGTWSASWQTENTRSSCSSCEKVGYHSGSLSFYRGVRSSGCRVVVFDCNEAGRVVENVIVP